MALFNVWRSLRGLAFQTTTNSVMVTQGASMNVVICAQENQIAKFNMTDHLSSRLGDRIV